MARGVVRRVFADRGFGFIQSDSGRDYFFHRSDVLHIPFETLQVGQAVEFSLVATPQGPRARSVRVIETDTLSLGPRQ